MVTGLSALIFSDMATAETQKKAANSQSVKASPTIKAVPGTPEGVLLMHRGDQDADFRSGVFWPAP